MTRKLPPLYALRAFEATARLNSFTRAGEALSITQSAVSRHIRTLEDHFACRLFVRSGRSLQLTEAARVLLPGVREGFAALERACDTLRGEDEMLRMKAPSTLTMRWLLARLSRFRRLQPGNEVQLTSAWMDVDHVDFNQEPFDCAVLLGDGVFPAEWEVRKLFPELLVPVGAPGLLDDGPWTATRLASSELLHPTMDKRDWRVWLERLGLSSRVSLKGGQVFDTLELGMIAAARGYGVSIGDLMMVAEDVAQGRMSLPWPTAVPSGMDYYLVWPRTRPGGERLRRLSAFLQAEVNAMALPEVVILPAL
ncbi:LysR family transcriptional regulator [Pseudomonas fulva]|uniref:LysR substrate-binding domain-containing protein n=1 Tax=Pseudomonas fulva TaxID=47880 RepID=UPI0018AB1A62|nr:LysR substrate-binding domain-containing protein [Pseudomonas fulva]MBF8635267.1 LysR family transcriptional regulator [Pseudomonas fulva]MBF8687293.1 LysR family transcriptional regulator [Pseudomonas fulva]MBF8691321.1 LysR family transcriptional regulator [Pseudomonas fulva]MEC4021501.1 LysR substrate-binding domain-containing protein [Pseudomonas fulva]